MKNLVSIIIPTLNSEKTINRTINSVLKQDYKNWEIIIIDSFSNDKTIKYIKSFGLKKIKIFTHPKSKGLASARYYGIKKAKGELIAFLDSDDEWRKKKLNYQHNLHNSSKKKFTCTGYSLVNSRNNELKIIPNLEKFNFNYLLSNRPIALSTVMIQRKLATKVFKRDLKDDYAEDYSWWLLALKHTDYCYILPKNLCKIYLGSENRSFNFFKNFNSLYKIYRNKFNLGNTYIFIIFLKLIYRTLVKNVFKLTSFFLGK